jgi:WD40 repeat protein
MYDKDDLTIKVGDLNKRRCLRTIDHAHGSFFVKSLSMSLPTSKLVSGGDDKDLKVWDCL